MANRDRQLSIEEEKIYNGSVEGVKKLTEGKGRFCFVKTFGCQQNEADSEKIAGMAKSMGYEICDTPLHASLIVVNTCAVREHAEKKALSVIGQYKHCKKNNPELVIAVCGCMVSQGFRADELKMKYPYVDFSFGTSDLHLFPSLLLQRLEGGKRSFTLPPDEPPVPEIMPINRASDYKAWVSIMYGCNNFCTYCIVPYVRGRERSRNPECVKEEVKSLVDSGYKDITLLGQNVNSYGTNCSFDCNFAKLLAAVSSFEGDYRIHFMTSHPKDATRELVDVMASNEHIAKQFHLPAQSGSSDMLKKMNRGYTVEKYLDTVNYIREKMPDCVISTDIIVGFPGETDEDFEMTLELLRKVRYDMVYSFIYSPRKGTPASKMENQVPEEIKTERMKRLLELQTSVSDEINAKYLGKTVRVLCCGASQTDSGMLECRTEGGKMVLIPASDAVEGEYLNVKITKTGAYALKGEKC